MLPHLLISSAHALGGAFVGTDPTEVAGSSATIVAVAVEGDSATLTVTARAATELDDAAYLWPAPGLDRASLASPDPDGLVHLEAFTRARVDEITCDELVETVRYRTPPGCASYDVPIPEPDPRGEDAAAAVGVRLEPIEADPDLVVVEADDLDTWLADFGLEPAAEAREALQPWVDAGVPFVVTRLTARIPEGAWLPPIRFTVDGTALDLPLLAGAMAARTSHELTVLTVAAPGTGDPALVNHPEEVVQDECMLPPVTGAEAWWDEALEAFRGSAVAPWVTVYAGPADRCDPCPGELVTPLDLADLGMIGIEAADLRLGRLVLRYAPDGLDEDPHLTFEAPRTDVQTRWIARTEGLGFAFETCGEGFDPEDVCADVRPPDAAGCAVGPRAPLLGGLLVVVFLAGRRRLAPLALLFLPLAADAAKGPRTEAHATLGLLGTNRVHAEPGAGGPPGPLSPFVGVEARRTVVAPEAVDIGLIGAVRAWRGRAGTQAFTFVEPSAGVDFRHGRMREGDKFCPYGRYGARVAIPVLDPRAIPPLTAVSSMFHLGAGAWLGSGALRPALELRATVLPRTDGYVTTFHPETQLDGWTFFPGTANVELVIGAAFY